MIELALGVVEPEERGSDFPAAVFIAEAADNAVSRLKVLHLNHRPLARLVGAGQFLCNPAIHCAMARIAQPCFRNSQIGRGRRDDKPFWDPLITPEGFQQITSLL